MKLLSIIGLSIIMMMSCSSTSKKDEQNIEESIQALETVPVLFSDTIFTFDNCEEGKIPLLWSEYYTGKGNATEWKVVKDGENNVLAQLSKDNPNYHFNEIVFDKFKVKNVKMKVRMKGVDGRMDQGGGFVWRFIDTDNYYVVRANPLEDNVVLYKVENGKRTDLPVLNKGRTYGVDVKPLGSGWNNLGLTVSEDLFTVFLNDEQIFQVKDTSFTKAGKIGLWTKADAITYFDDFEVKAVK